MAAAEGLALGSGSDTEEVAGMDADQLAALREQARHPRATRGSYPKP